MPLSEGWKLYKAHIERPIVAGGVKKSTQKRYRAVFQKFIPFANSRGIETWQHVSLAVVHDYAAKLDKDGYAAKSIRNELVTIVQAQKWLIEEKHLVGASPIKLRLRKVESRRAYCFTADPVQAMLHHCWANPRLHWLARVIIALASTGMRIAELAGLKWTEVNLTSGMITLTDETGRGGLAVGERRQLKSGRSRSVPIHPDFATVLKSLSRKDAYVFRGPRGGRLKPDTVRSIFIREVITALAERFPSAAGEQGFETARLHSFRHYFASMCAINPEVSELTAMEWLGHADSEMLRHYFHLHNSESKRQMNGLDLIGKAGLQHPGINGAVNKNQEASSQGSDPTIAS